MAERILIIEDEAKIARVLSLELEHEGYETDTAGDGRIGMEKIDNDRWDLILLDIMIPKLSGIEVLRRMRAAGNLTPVILLTAKDTVPDKVTGLDHGANDYVTKPFEIEELLARIRACLRTVKIKQSKTAANILQAGQIKVNKDTREVTIDKEEVALTPREYDLLVYFMENANQVLQREQIVEQVWGYDFMGDTNVVDVYVRYIRKKIDACVNQSYIHTVRGVGYCFKES
ncbi:response regulator transcription factor [Scopulibacillus cellulosilyticus]|uniref:Response regulator transcription factor n=1 Tax=Scopulibacillus cellulosilyticus TaxID=2665665 RepID=A0ABW2PTV7_9BACL